MPLSNLWQLRQNQENAVAVPFTEHWEVPRDHIDRHKATTWLEPRSQTGLRADHRKDAATGASDQAQLSGSDDVKRSIQGVVTGCYSGYTNQAVFPPGSHSINPANRSGSTGPLQTCGACLIDHVVLNVHPGASP